MTQATAPPAPLILAAHISEYQPGSSQTMFAGVAVPDGLTPRQARDYLLSEYAPGGTWSPPYPPGLDLPVPGQSIVWWLRISDVPDLMLTLSWNVGDQT